ncbi:MAG: pyridoxal-phosphate dependent enzyme, partial [Candidatus Rokuibacteriota bacterium]
MAAVHYIDPSTGQTYPLTETRWRADNGHYLNLAPGPGLRRSDIDTARRSVWRYARALMVGVEHAVSLGEGWTPLLDGEWHGAPVHYKLEFMMPTGSFKDRGMTVLVSYLKSRGVTRVLEDSSGNAGASLSAYAAAAGLACRILVPETASYPKIAQIAACGADVVTIKGSRQEVADAALRQSAEIFYASHNWQPFFVEGVKTLAYELWEQAGFRAPDNLVVPLGYGSNVLGAERGFDELLRTGEIARRPRLFGVQAARCAPYA